MTALTTSKESTVSKDYVEDDSEVTEEDLVENEAVQNGCVEKHSENFDLTGDEQVEDENEAEILEENDSGKIVESAQVVASDLKKGKSCRLKSEGEKLSKIIRKTVNDKKSKQNIAELETVEAEENVKKDLKQNMKEKKVKSKRDTHPKENVEKHSNHKKSDKKKSKSTNEPLKGKKKSTKPKKSFKSDQKTSKKNLRSKKSSRKEL